MVDMDEKIDNDIESAISTKCIKGHKFTVPAEKIQTSSTGKSFITLCPKCNGVARLKREEVIKLFGINPRDHVAVGKLYADLASGGTPSKGQTTEMPPMVGDHDIPEDDLDEEDDEEDDDDEEDEDDEEDDEDTEYTAVVETVPDVTGKKKSVKRFRLEVDEDDDDEEEDVREKTPIKRSKPAQKQQKPARKPSRRHEEEYEEDEMEDVREQPRRQSRGKQQRYQNVEDEVFDPNDVLMELIEESGLDDATIDRIADYVHMQPDGWQPAAIQGVLAMYLSPAASNKIAQRYQAELYKEEKKREKERQMLNLIGTPSSNMRLFDPNSNVQNFAPINQPLRQSSTGMQPVPQFQQYNPQYPQAPYPQQEPPYPRTSADFFGMGSRSKGVTTAEVEAMLEKKLEDRFKELTKTITDSKREEAAMTDARDMRNLVFELLKGKNTETPAAPAQNPQMVELLKAQSDLTSKLLTNALEKKAAPMDDPLMKILLQEVFASKKSNSAPPLANTSEELGQRIQLQRLANDLELAQADFRDKQEGRAFTRDLAGQALSKIGEAAATAYIETQRIQAEAQKSIAAHDRIVRMNAPAPVKSPHPVKEDVITAVKPEQKMVVKESVNTESLPKFEQTHKVRGIPDEDGIVHLPCPTCNSDMTAKVGDKTVSCPICNTVYNANVPRPTVPDKLPETVPEPMPIAPPVPDAIITPDPVITPNEVVTPEPVLDRSPDPDPKIEPVEENLMATRVKTPPAKRAKAPVAKQHPRKKLSQAIT